MLLLLLLLLLWFHSVQHRDGDHSNRATAIRKALSLPFPTTQCTSPYDTESCHTRTSVIRRTSCSGLVCMCCSIVVVVVVASIAAKPKGVGQAKRPRLVPPNTYDAPTVAKGRFNGPRHGRLKGQQGGRRKSRYASTTYRTIPTGRRAFDGSPIDGSLRARFFFLNPLSPELHAAAIAVVVVAVA
jgi:hypothetical protein